MSVSDPLLKKLKGYTLNIVEVWNKNDNITDECPDVQPFCECMEQVFQKGLLQCYSNKGFIRSSESWNWLEKMVDQGDGATFNYISAITEVKNCPKVCTPQGKLRLLIRTCLTKKCLHVPVQMVVRGQRSCSAYDTRNSILGDEILGEIFLSVLLQCSRLAFTLDLANASFLDITWSLPHRTQIEFVPCKALGISVCFVSGKAVIIEITANSVAAEDNKIEIGDILDELNGHSITTNTHGKLSSIMKKAAGQPIQVFILKAHSPSSSDLYHPLKDILRQTTLDVTKLQAKFKAKEYADNKDDQDETNVIRSGFEVTYLGCVSTGGCGNVKQIRNAMAHATSSNETREETMFECQQIGVRITSKLSGNTILRHSYMSISSCGQVANMPTHFAYIAGDQSCNVAEVFTCYVFQCGNPEFVSTILHSISQGFERTHYAV